MANGGTATADRTTMPSAPKTGREPISAYIRHRQASIRRRWPITRAMAVAVTTLVRAEVAIKTIAIETRHDETVAEVDKRRVEIIDEDANHEFEVDRLIF